MATEQIKLRVEDVREGLRLERAQAEAHDLYHVAENQLQMYVTQIGMLYGVPDGWQLRDWLRGFEPPLPGGEGANDG